MKKFTHYLAISFLGLMLSLSSYAKTVVVIDAGHGGKDPGAIGKGLRLQEKTVTLAISKELKYLLDKDPNFKAVMTRHSDSFIHLPNRTEIARKNRANYLISIHADSSPKSNNLKGASVWVLSNRRASDEMGKWLEDSEKQSELLGGAGSVLSNANERYLNQTVLDLQFSHSQRSGYELGKAVLARLGNVTTLAKNSPQHASLSVLRSPDITSILVETGFLSNPSEEQKLANPAYRRKIARAIYNGLVAYRARHAGMSNKSSSDDDDEQDEKNSRNKTNKDKKSESKQAIKKESKEKNADKNEKKSKEKDNDSDNAKSDKKRDKKERTKDKDDNDDKRGSKKSNSGYHVVKKDETLYSIARAYGTTPEKLSKLNDIKNNKITVGKRLKLK